jgi:NADH:ubiquinone oxidoreductase subunit C
MNLSGVDDANGQSINDEEGGLKISRYLSVYYHIESTRLDTSLFKVSAPERIFSCFSLLCMEARYWHEREAYDLLGIKFQNHPI